MIESPRALRISVPDLALATQWYTQAFDVEASEVRENLVVFHVQSFAVSLVPGPANPHAHVLYWGVDDVHAEHQRLLNLQEGSGAPLAPTYGLAEDAVVHDPFGNPFGLTARGEPDIRRARSQRAAEKIALRNVRGTLDQLKHEDIQQQKIRRFFAVAGALVAIALITLTVYSTIRAKNLQTEKPLAVPGLERR